MLTDNPYPLTAYEEISPLCEKGHIMLVRNKLDGQLYVKKTLSGCNPEIFLRLKENPVQHTPAIFGIYKIAAEANCMNTPAVSDNDSSDSGVIIIEEYISGSTLDELLRNEKRFSEKEVIDISLQLCRILLKLHRMKPAIIHRDIKPSNVMLSQDGTVTLLDFNVAKIEKPYQNKDTVLLGTAGFAAPEQYGFKASSHQTDIYNLGVLMNLLLTRRLPADQPASGKLSRIIHFSIPHNRTEPCTSQHFLLRGLYGNAQILSVHALIQTLATHHRVPAGTIGNHGRTYCGVNSAGDLPTDLASSD